MIARHVRVRGRVQGVAYRWWTEQNARELDVTGWVRNDSDGSVEAHLEGKPEHVERLIERMRGGPPAAKVSSLDAIAAEIAGFDGFETRR